MLATFLKPEGNYLKKVVNVPTTFTILINEIFNPENGQPISGQDKWPR